MGCLPGFPAFAGNSRLVGLALPAKPFLTFVEPLARLGGAQPASTAQAGERVFACETFAGRGQS
ncbi:MAG: hypothetical protein A3H31_01655 [Gallionellales bacterium RIFCSPLOWO2_02_FULL_57_47]|nr:MAG: hypothetical protein A3H31_01655 [Gallionellales bacterium RIFCSPLOWO2_02_FULL_57_47]